MKEHGVGALRRRVEHGKWPMCDLVERCIRCFCDYAANAAACAAIVDSNVVMTTSTVSQRI